MTNYDGSLIDRLRRAAVEAPLPGRPKFLAIEDIESIILQHAADVGGSIQDLYTLSERNQKTPENELVSSEISLDIAITLEKTLFDVIRIHDAQNGKFSWNMHDAVKAIEDAIKPYLRTTEPTIPEMNADKWLQILDDAKAYRALKPVTSELTKSEGYLKGIAHPCGCHKCDDARRADPNQHVMPRLMILCSQCGNKRCPHATDHELACSGSNDPGQKGSVYE